MKNFLLSAAVFAMFGAAGASLSACGGGTQAQTPFDRLGGEQGIRKVVNDAIPCLATSQRIGVYFKGLSGDSLERIAVCLTKQLCAASGGPCQYPTTITYTSPVDGQQRQYTCRNMLSSHQGMIGKDGKGIDNGDFDEFVMCVQKSMQQNNVPQDLQDAVVGILQSQRNDVVDKRQR